MSNICVLNSYPIVPELIHITHYSDRGLILRTLKCIKSAFLYESLEFYSYDHWPRANI